MSPITFAAPGIFVILLLSHSIIVGLHEEGELKHQRVSSGCAGSCRANQAHSDCTAAIASSSALTQLCGIPECPATPLVSSSHVAIPPVPSVGPKSALS